MSLVCVLVDIKYHFILHKTMSLLKGSAVSFLCVLSVAWGRNVSATEIPTTTVLGDSTVEVDLTLKVDPSFESSGEVVRLMEYSGVDVGFSKTGVYSQFYTKASGSDQWVSQLSRIRTEIPLLISIATYSNDNGEKFALSLNHSLVVSGIDASETNSLISYSDDKGFYTVSVPHEGETYGACFAKRVEAIKTVSENVEEIGESQVNPYRLSLGGLPNYLVRFNEGDLSAQEESKLMSQTVDRCYYKNYNSSKSFDAIYTELMQWEADGYDQLPSLTTKNWQSPWQETNFADNYAEILESYLVVQTSGTYTLWLSADEKAALWFEEDGADMKLIASVGTKVDEGIYDASQSQKSGSIYLEKGKVYRLRALHIEGTGDDHFSIAWSIPGESQDEPTELIPSSVLSAPSSGKPGEFPRYLAKHIESLPNKTEITTALTQPVTGKDESTTVTTSAYPLRLSDFKCDSGLYRLDHQNLGKLYIADSLSSWPQISCITNAQSPYNWTYLKGSSSPQWFYNQSENRWYALTEDGLVAAPVVLEPPKSKSSKAGSNVVLSCEVQGAKNYYWYKDNQLLSKGSNTLNLDAVTASDSGDYLCLITNSVGEAVTETATVRIESIIIGSSSRSLNAKSDATEASVTTEEALKTSDSVAQQSTVKTTLKSTDAQSLSSSESEEVDVKNQQNAADLDLSVF